VQLFVDCVQCNDIGLRKVVEVLAFVAACVVSNRQFQFVSIECPRTAWKQIPKCRTNSVFSRQYSVFFGIVNSDVGIGIGILKYPIYVRFFGILNTNPLGKLKGSTLRLYSNSLLFNA